MRGILSLIIATCFFLSLPSLSDAAVVGKFTLVEGNVDLLKGGALPAVPARLNLSVEEKDVIRTKSASRAEITMIDKTVLRIAQRSRIDVSEYSADASKKGIVRLERGKVEALVVKKPVSRITTGAKSNIFEIHTPNAVAGVRGTNFFVSFLKNISITLVKDGDVCVFNQSSPDHEICMPPNFITSVVGSQQPGQPKPATSSDFKNFEKEFIGTPGGSDQSQGGSGQSQGGSGQSQGGSGQSGGNGQAAAAPLVDSPPSADLTAPPAGPALSPATITDPPIIVPPSIDNSVKYDVDVVSKTVALVPDPDSEDPDNPSMINKEIVVGYITGDGKLSVNEINETAALVVSGTSTLPVGPVDPWYLNVMTQEPPTGPYFEADLNSGLTGQALGFWYDTAPVAPETGIFVGETTGTYNPSNTTWQANVQGAAWLETNQYLDMIATDAGRTSLAAMNVPAIEVGRVDLSGFLPADGTIGIERDGIIDFTDYVTLFMSNVIFFRTSTNTNPSLWATRDFSYSDGVTIYPSEYDFRHVSTLSPATITNSSNAISLTDGDTISAKFQFTEWQSGKWAGSLSDGTGDLTVGSGPATLPVNFKGAAAGTFTGTTSGTLAGTAAGIVK